MVAFGRGLGVRTLDRRPDISATITRPPPDAAELFLDVFHPSDAGAAFVAARIAAFVDREGMLAPPAVASRDSAR